MISDQSDTGRKKVWQYRLRALVELITAPIRVPLIGIAPGLVCRIWGHDWSEMPWNAEIEDEPVYRCWICGDERTEDCDDLQTMAERYREAKGDA